MTRARRRTARKDVQKSPSRSQSPSTVDVEAGNGGEEESCPACKADTSGVVQEFKESWIECDACKTWFHWRCAGNGENMELINKWYCQSCLEKDSTRAISVKTPTRKSSRKRTQQDYANLNSGIQSDPHRWIRVLESKGVPEANFNRMHGSQVGLEWLNGDDNAMKEPIIIESAEGLGMKMPNSNITIRNIAESIGEDIPVEVIDVASQANSSGWTLGKWAEYYEQEPSQRDKIRNVISLEISGTKLADHVLPPRLVREIDWVEKFWPSKSKGKVQYPKVQLYCLMGVATAYTDWHIDFAGSSVYYHILRGSKIFYFIRPTPQNLAAYERWSGSELQNQTWLGDMVDEVVKVTLYAGNTMIIPTGWIHAVYTPIDALVFGGNFLHSYNIDTQLKVYDIEIATRVPKKFRFPLFSKLCWYVGEKYLQNLKNKEEFPQRVLEGIQALAKYLVSEVRTMERGTEQAKKDVKEQVPTDRVRDPAAVARELRWRAKLAEGYTSDDDMPSHTPRDGKATPNGYLENGTNNKRKRAPSEEAGNKRNFRPKLWDATVEHPIQRDAWVLKVKKPDKGPDWKDVWIDWEAERSEEIDGEKANVSRQKNLVVKIRRTSDGLERHRIERVVEEWSWAGETSESSPIADEPSQTKEEEAVEVEI